MQKLYFQLLWYYHQKLLLFIYSTIFFFQLYHILYLIYLVGIIGKDGSSVAHYLISEEKLNKEEPRLFGNSDSKDYLKICINVDGNLKNQLNLDNSMDQLNSLYSLNDTLNSHITTLSSYQESTYIKQTFISKNYDVKFLYVIIIKVMILLFLKLNIILIHGLFF